MLTQNLTLKVSIEGHIDNVGSPTSNQTLSVNRANAVVNTLIVKGCLVLKYLSVKDWGQTKLIADNSKEEGKVLNRRVEIVKL